MKLITPVLVFVCVFVGSAVAQVQPDMRRTIEVSGSAERWVMPDEFTFKITLVERIENKKKTTIEQQEEALKVELARLGVDVAKDLSIYDISSMYFRKRKDVLGMKDYKLKIRDLNKIALLQDLGDRLNVSRLELIDSENSRMTEIRREVKIEAMKAAKAKAEYLAAAIAERVGKAIEIEEVEEEKQGYRIDGSSSTSNTFIIDGNRRETASTGDDTNLSFSPEKVRFVINGKFELE